MRVGGRSPVCALLGLGALLAGCAQQASYSNPSHPGYGKAEYDRDWAKCQKDNSRTFVRSGYDDVTVTEVDQPKARACMTALGWQQ